MNQGYIGLFRKFFNEHEFWKEKRKYSKAEAWIDLLQMARWKDEPIKLLDSRGAYTLDFADIYISERFLGTRWMWSTKKVRNYLSYLLERESITFKKRSSHRTIINITNLNTYLKWIKGERSSEEAVRKQSGSSEEAKKKKVKKEKKEKNKDIYSEFPELNIEAWKEWLVYKRLIKSNYKTDTGERTKIKALISISNGDKDQQAKLVKHAIGEEWKGIHIPNKGKGKVGGFKTQSERNTEAKNEYLDGMREEKDITPLGNLNQGKEIDITP